MKPKRKVEQAIRHKLHFTADAAFRSQLLTEVLSEQEQSRETTPALSNADLGRTIMKRRTARLASVAALIAAAALAVSLLPRLAAPAYAVEQTVAALQTIRFLHLTERDDGGQIEDERWIEIGADGFQIRYRQETPSCDFGVIEDSESTAVYRHEKQAVVIYDRDDMQFQWVGRLGEIFENLRQEGKVLEEHVEYRGRPAHRVWWPALKGECYVDPVTKLPMAAGTTEMSYEAPPAGAFDIVLPEGYAVIDRRPGTETNPLPQWLIDEDIAREQGEEAFRQAAYALARGEYPDAALLFEEATECEPRRNWAWFWLGSACYAQGYYDLAIENFTKVLEISEAFGGGGEEPLGYCNYARGLAYAKLGMEAEAEADLKACLPEMVRTLRLPSAGEMFEYADNPLIRYDEYEPTDQEVVAGMVNRLRLITGQDFGYDPDATAEENEAAITTWEQWLAIDGRIDVTFDAPLVESSTAGQ